MMAKNKKNKKRNFETIAKEILSSDLHKREELSAKEIEYLNKLETEKKRNKELIDRYEKTKSEIEGFTLSGQSNEKFEELLDQYTVSMVTMEQHEKNISNLETKLQDEEDKKEQLVEKQTQKQIATKFSSKAIKEGISNKTRQAQLSKEAIKKAKTIETVEINEMISQKEGEVEKIRSQIIETASADPKEREEKLPKLATKLEKAQSELVSLSTSASIQKKLKIDTPSQYFKSFDVVERTERELNKTGIYQKVKSEGGGTYDNKDRDTIQSELNSVNRDVIEAQKKWVEAVDNNTKDAKELKEKFDKLEQTQSDYHTAIKAIDHYKVPEKDKLREWGNTAAGIGKAAIAGGNMYSQWTIEQEMDKSRLRTGYYNIANQRFDDARAASAGDAAAILRIQKDSYGKAAKFGLERGEEAVGAGVAGTAGSGLIAAASAIEAFAPIGKIMKVAKAAKAAKAATAAKTAETVGTTGKTIEAANKVKGSDAATVVGEIATAAQNTSGGLARLQSGATRSEAIQAGYGSKMTEDTAQQYMDAATLQRVIDVTRQSYRSTAGSGSNRKELLSGLRDVGFQGEMADKYGFSQEQQMSLASEGIGALGKKFKKEDIGRAGEAFNAGLVQSPEQYMSLRGQISGQGGNEKDLETLMKNAIASGMDSSKNIAEMVQATTSLASATSAGGVSTYGGAAASLAAGAQALTDIGVDPNMAASAALNAAQQLDSAIGNQGMTIPGLIQRADLSNIGFQLGGAEMGAASTLKPAEARTAIAAMNEADKIINDPNSTEEQKQKAIKDRRTAYGNTGLAGYSGPGAGTTKLVEDVSRINLMKGVSELSGDWMYADPRGKLLKRAISGESLSEEEHTQADEFWKTLQKGANKPASSLDAFLGVGDVTKEARQESLDKSKIDGDSGKQMDAAQASRGVLEYSEGLKQINNDLTKIVETMKKESSILTPDAFKNMIKGGADVLENSIKALNTTVNNLNLKLGGTTPELKQDLNKNVNQLQYPPRGMK